jgi:hypothetical protein
MLRHVPRFTRLHVIGRESSMKIMKRLIDEFEGQLSWGDIYDKGFTNYVSQL